MRISDWSSDVCSSDLEADVPQADRGSGEATGAHPVDPRLLLTRTRSSCSAICSRTAAETMHPAENLGHGRGGRARGAFTGRAQDRQSVVQGKSGSGRGDLGGCRLLKKKKKKTT